MNDAPVDLTNTVITGLVRDRSAGSDAAIIAESVVTEIERAYPALWKFGPLHLRRPDRVITVRRWPRTANLHQALGTEVRQAINEGATSLLVQYCFITGILVDTPPDGIEQTDRRRLLRAVGEVVSQFGGVATRNLADDIVATIEPMLPKESSAIEPVSERVPDLGCSDAFLGEVMLNTISDPHTPALIALPRH